MAKRLRVKPNRNLRENAQLLVPIMFDVFLSQKDRVVAHPVLKNELHRMRVDGKTLRYAMEVFAPAFGEEFVSCLREVKGLLDVMGKIHDCDVNIPKLQTHVQEMRLFNRSVHTAAAKISTTSMVRLIREQKDFRNSLFEEMKRILAGWGENNFKGKVLQSMLSNV